MIDNITLKKKFSCLRHQTTKNAKTFESKITHASIDPNVSKSILKYLGTRGYEFLYYIDTDNKEYVDLPAELACIYNALENTEIIKKTFIDSDSLVVTGYQTDLGDIVMIRGYEDNYLGFLYRTLYLAKREGF